MSILSRERNAESGGGGACHLNEGHLRRLSSVMAIVDSMISRMLDLVNERTVATPMMVIEETLSAEERQSLKESLVDLRALIADFAGRYDLEPSRKRLRRALITDSSQIWTLLEDCRPSRMRGYGSINDSDTEILETEIQKFLHKINEITQVFDAVESV